ncbi:hypothetical protein JSY14_10070 [Brachybacterium sp. EF45031]|uniref:hypothetical protein n=1 Tax=Brachybacterium sillae TaxID=2810536 RepID=UPI00217DEB6F|nr:hypothetical protein [Brachybacterium sillae]MCS6712350.1 hypothetical protein [Brachybacterium sillae]
MTADRPARGGPTPADSSPVGGPGGTSLRVLRAPSTNRVYADTAGPLVTAELRWVLGAHLGQPVLVRDAPRAGLELMTVETPAPRDQVLQLLPATSAVQGVFLPHPVGAGNAERELLEPLEPAWSLRHPSALETTLKYPGKTNEQFTALLIALAAALSGHRSGLLDGTLRLLDPLCGRGTTLNRALRLGLSPLGAEVDAKDVEQYRVFLGTWLKDQRLPHHLDHGALTVARKRLGTRLEVRIATDRAAQRRGEEQTVTVLGCDTAALDALVPARSVDALVADLPYGVQHGGRADGVWRRSPLDLLAAAAPAWRGLLRRDAGMALAINRHSTPPARAAEVLTDAGFRVLPTGDDFRHRVDRSIDRDVVLAVPADHPEGERLAALADQLQADQRQADQRQADQPAASAR